MRKCDFLFLLIIAFGCGPIYPLTAGGPYKGRVIDAETKAPIAGAAVLAVWYQHSPGIGSSVDGYLDAEEVLTDKNGDFTVGQYPPASLLPGTWVTGPNITIFYPNYGYWPRYQVKRYEAGYKALLNEMERGTVAFELPPLKEKKEIEKSYLLVDPVEVPNEKKPNLIRLMNQQRRDLG